MHTSHLVLTNKMSELDRLRDFLEDLANQWDIPPAVGMSVNLALEEAFANIVNYAFKDKLSHEIAFGFHKKDDQLVISISDHGQPFDPTNRPSPDLTLSAEDRPIGGLGIFLVNKIMDKVEYERKKNTNQLTLTKLIDQ